MAWWEELPRRGVTVLAGADAGDLAAASDPLPEKAPAILTYFTGRPRNTAQLARSIVDELEKTAIALFPLWLPAAEGIGGTGGSARAAVRALARRLAATTGHFAPFLADLAERSLTGTGRSGTAAVFAPEVRMAGLAKVIAAGYARRDTALLVHVPPGLTAPEEETLVAACEWLADHGGLAVWLAGAPLTAVDRVPAVQVTTARVVDRVPAVQVTTARVVDRVPAVQVTTAGMEVRAPAAPPRPGLTYPPVAGLPHPGSAAERTLEAALAPLDWAAGRVWNEMIRLSPLATPYRVDLLWRDERCVVEVDGPDHRGREKFEDDRRRDVHLQTAGYVVLRFTNDRVLADTGSVVHQIGRFLRKLRTGMLER